MAAVKKVGGINKYEVNSISATNAEVCILRMLNCLKMDFRMIYLKI
jgi:hypothetical protein